MEYKNYLKYFIIIGLMIIVIVLFLPIKTEISNNIPVYCSLIDLGIADYGFASALLVGLIGFFTTIYTNDKNLKATKISLIPEKSLELYNQMKILLLFYNNEKFNDYDEITVYLDILSLLKEYLIVFQLYTPKLYDDILNIILENSAENFDYEHEYEKNAQLIINEILFSLLDYSSEKNKPFIYKNSKKCDDLTDIELIGENIEFDINKKNFTCYIDSIKGPRTKKIAKEKFSSIIKSINEVIEKLDKEKEKFGLKDF